MKKSRNRLTPLLVAILVCLVWILIFSIIYKLMNSRKTTSIKKLKLDDDLVQELYSYVTDDDILIYSENEYDISNLPSTFIFTKATKFMTIEDVELDDKGQFKISYESLDGAIKTAFGPDFKYDLSNINDVVKTNFEIDDNNLLFDVRYDSNNKVYTGTYKQLVNNQEIKTKHELVQATKNSTVNLKIGYVIYKVSDKIQICSNSTCDKIEKEIDSLDNYEYDKFITVSLKKASDEVYYYDSNS